MKERGKRYLKNKFIYTIKAIKSGYKHSAIDYLNEIKAITTYLYIMDEISEYNYIRLINLTYTIKRKYILY